MKGQSKSLEDRLLIIILDKRYYWGAAFVYLSFVAYASLCPVPLLTANDFPKKFQFTLDLFLDKILHMGAYIGAGFIFRGLTNKTKMVAYSLSLFGITMEIGQYFMPTRSFEILDMVANCLGVLSGIFISSKLKIYWPDVTTKIFLYKNKIKEQLNH